MENADHVYTLPDDLPVPEDDGAADHLLNAVVPPLKLRSTEGEEVDVAELPGRTRPRNE